MSRLRVLLSVADLSGGGAERETWTLARQLSRERFELHLLLHRPVFAYPPPEGIALHVLSRTRPWHGPATVRGIRQVLEAVRPDVVLSQLHFVNLLTGSALAGLAAPPAWLPRFTGDPRRQLRFPLSRWARRALARARLVLGCGEGVRGALVEHLSLDPARVAAIDNAVDAGAIAAGADLPLPVPRDPEAFVVVHAGRSVAQKRPELVLEAFAALRSARPRELWMLGDGPLRPALERRARALGLAGCVRFPGFVANPYPWLRAADALALPSDHEGLPNVLIEAALCGTPAVAARCRFGPEELIEDGVDGRLVPVGDAGALARALQALADDRARARRLGARARARAEARFDTAKVCAAYESLLLRAAEAR